MFPFSSSHYRVAAASITPAPLNAAGLLMTTSTGYFHSMNLVQPAIEFLVSTPEDQQLWQDRLPQYAQRRPKYFPTKGTKTIVNSNSNCSKLSLHSASASEKSSDRVSRSESVVASEGSEATSSSEVDEYGFGVEGTM
jgi:hypothetical protein